MMNGARNRCSRGGCGNCYRWLTMPPEIKSKKDPKEGAATHKEKKDLPKEQTLTSITQDVNAESSITKSYYRKDP